MGARERLVVLAQRAGYSPAALDRLAQATLPAYAPGARLTDGEVAAVCAAVQTCAQSGMRDDHVALLVEDYRARFGAQWRQRFWRARLRATALRFNDPDRYGRSPCDDPSAVGAREARDAAPTGSAGPEPLPPGFVAPAAPTPPPPGAPVSPDIHPAIAAAPVLRGPTAV